MILTEVIIGTRYWQISLAEMEGYIFEYNTPHLSLGCFSKVQTLHVKVFSRCCPHAQKNPGWWLVKRERDVVPTALASGLIG